VLETYEALRDRITRFEEMPLEERSEVFQLTTGLRQLVWDSKDSFPKPRAALLHDTLTHAVLFFIGVYELEWERSGAASMEPPQMEDAKADIRRRTQEIALEDVA
jgi:hypothetical protein